MTDKQTQHTPAHGGYRYSRDPEGGADAQAAAGRRKRRLRIGMLATAAFGTVAVAAGAAQAVTVGVGSSANSGGIAIANNETFALSNPHDQTTFKDSFTIHQYGDVLSANVRNDATAESVACSSASPCRAVSISFQIITMAGENIHLNAVNLGNATNEHCAGCQSMAGAYQFVLSTPTPFTLSRADLAQLDTIHGELNALTGSSLSLDQVQSRADALALQVAAILKSAAATAPAATTKGPVAQPMTAASGAAPTVQVFRDYQQH